MTIWRNFLPIPHGYGCLLCLFCVNGDGLLLHWHALPKLELITTGGISVLPDLLGLFYCLQAVMSVLRCCSLDVRTETAKVVCHGEKLCQYYFCWLFHHWISRMVHIRFDSLRVCLLSLTSSLSPRLYLGLGLLAGAYVFSWGEGCSSLGFLSKMKGRGKERLHVLVNICGESGPQ